MADRLDRIYVRNLKCRCILGINPDEREKKQDVVINLVLEADLSDACGSDAIDDTVDYKRVKQRVLALVENSDHFLVERIVERIAETCLEDERVQAVQVSLDKPGALRFAESVAVEIYRSRDGR